MEDKPISQLIATLQQKLKQASLNMQVSAVEAVKIDGIRSELDAIGVSLMFGGLLKKYRDA